MIYKFKSKAAGDLILLGPSGDQILRLIGKEPAPQGIILPEVMPAAIQALEAAIAADEAEHQRQQQEAAEKGEELPPREGITLRQRAWPMIEMLKRCEASGKEIVWGV